MAYDPVTSQLGKAALEKLGSSEKVKTAPSIGGQESDFQKKLNNITAASSNDISTDTLLKKIDEDFGMNQKVKSLDASSIEVQFGGTGEVTHKTTAAGDLKNVFERLNNQQNEMDQMLAMVSSGESMSTKDLLQAQMVMSKASIGMDLFVKGGESLTKNMTQMFNMQI